VDPVPDPLLLRKSDTAGNLTRTHGFVASNSPLDHRGILISTHLRLRLSNAHFPSGFHASILYAFFFSPSRVTCLAHLILLHLIFLIVLGEYYKSRSSSLCSIPGSCHIISSVKIFSSAPCSQSRPYKRSPQLYRPSDRRLSAKLVLTFADRGCHVASVTDSTAVISVF
jgi:hypothetical protein